MTAADNHKQIATKYTLSTFQKKSLIFRIVNSTRAASQVPSNTSGTAPARCVCKFNDGMAIPRRARGRIAHFESRAFGSDTIIAMFTKTAQQASERIGIFIFGIRCNLADLFSRIFRLRL